MVGPGFYLRCSLQVAENHLQIWFSILGRAWILKLKFGAVGFDLFIGVRAWCGVVAKVEEEEKKLATWLVRTSIFI